MEYLIMDIICQGQWGEFNEIPRNSYLGRFLMPGEDIPQMSQIRMNQRPGIKRGGTIYDYE